MSDSIRTESSNHSIAYSPQNRPELEEMLHQRFQDLTEKEIKAILIAGVLMSCFGNENGTDEEIQNAYDFISLVQGYLDQQPEEVRIVQIGFRILQRTQERKEQ
ncbi:hypothetical protein TRFO_38949 [Tritrichomonas foetus]|uniref:Uncharacterized protein n=1 Tax=Tritrichomonas foetus TaxID=1144522 RepID=A0A1J4J9C1_9EUKA|nr:hypothetical protein TRFO_38949 [Tritrichomonas foetus]|eukprot:OHS94847.1 hypothetical protein TRFO_38949 [Tritrichomonas foetus]